MTVSVASLLAMRGPEADTACNDGLKTRHTLIRHRPRRRGIQYSHQQVDQMRDQGNVRCRHWILAQLVGADPGKLLPLPRDHLAVPAPADVERHQKMKIMVGVAGKGERGEARLAHRDAAFLR